MDLLRLIGNVIWLVVFGFASGLSWWFAGVLMVIFIITIPWAKACFVIGWFTFWPFGREAVSREGLTGKVDIGTGALGVIGNILWFVFAGIWLALYHLSLALFCCITIIFIPFGIQHFKLALVSLFPIGKTIVSTDEAREAHRDAVLRRP